MLKRCVNYSNFNHSKDPKIETNAEQILIAKKNSPDKKDSRRFDITERDYGIGNQSTDHAIFAASASSHMLTLRSPRSLTLFHFHALLLYCALSMSFCRLLLRLTGWRHSACPPRPEAPANRQEDRGSSG